MVELKRRGAKRLEAARRAETRVRDAERVLQAELSLLWRIHSLSYVMTRRPRADPALHARLSLVAWRVLLTLANVPGLSANEIVSLWGLEKMGVNRAVNELLKRDLVEPGKDPDGGRRIPLFLTQKGRDLHEEAWPGARIDYDLLADALTPEELVAFGRASDLLLSKARAITG